MRTMMKVQLDTEAASQAIADGSLQQVMEDTLASLQPEAAYFGPEDGVRTAFIVFDLADPRNFRRSANRCSARSRRGFRCSR